MGKVKTKDMSEPIEEQAVKAAETLVEETQETVTKEVKKKAKVSKRSLKQKKVRGKKYQAAAEKVDKTQAYPLNDAVELVKTISYSDFDGTFEIHLTTKVKGLRGLVSLPYASAKKVKILAFGKGAEESGADKAGDEADLAEVAKGRINYDVIVVTPEWMPKIAPLARVLGPRGVMPNPKNGTITDNLAKAVTEIQTGKVEYKAEPSGKAIHLSLGKVSQPTEELSQNIKVLLNVLGKTKIQKAVIKATQSPAVKVNLASI